MITARQFRNGIVVDIDKTLFVIVSAQHIKPGKGGAFVKAKLKNLQTGSIAERTLRPEDAFPQAYIEDKKVQFLYHDGSGYHFMDQITFEQVAIDGDMLGDGVKFIKDGMEITASCAEGEQGKVYDGILPYKIKKTDLGH